MSNSSVSRAIFATDKQLISLHIDDANYSFKKKVLPWLFEIHDFTIGVEGNFDDDGEMKVTPIVTGLFEFRKSRILPFSEPDHAWGELIKDGSLNIRRGNETAVTVVATKQGLQVSGVFSLDHFAALFDETRAKRELAMHVEFETWADPEEDGASRTICLMELDREVRGRMRQIAVA
jgi:hypothetical protein